MNTGAQRRLLTSSSVSCCSACGHGVHRLGGPSGNPLFNDWVYTGLMWSGVALCLARALSVREERARGWR